MVVQRMTARLRAIHHRTMKSSDPGRPGSRRGASGAWNRLKPVREDPLESYGLPSKGETRYMNQPLALCPIILPCTG